MFKNSNYCMNEIYFREKKFSSSRKYLILMKRLKNFISSFYFPVEKKKLTPFNKFPFQTALNSQVFNHLMLNSIGKFSFEINPLSIPSFIQLHGNTYTY